MTAPGITFTNQTGTGIYRTALGLGLLAFGAVKAFFAAALATFYTPVQMDSTLAVTGAVTVGGDLNVNGITGMERADLPAVGLVSSAAFTTDTNSTVGNDLSPEITLTGATGRPIMVMLQSGNTGFGTNIYVESDAGGGRYATIKIQRKIGAGAYATIATYYGSSAASEFGPIGVTPFLDSPGAGDISYKVVGLVSNALGRVFTSACQLVAYEL